MTYVVTEACIRCKYMDCVEVCPQEAFHAGANFVVINPSRCANCSLCEVVCPVQAIYSKEALPDEHRSYIALNARLAAEWPLATEKVDVPADADQWAEVGNKKQYLLELPAKQ